MTSEADDDQQSYQWFVMRDLKRPNAKERAYQYLERAGFDVFTPLYTRVREVHGKRIREDVPFINDLLFVFSTRSMLDPVVQRIDTLQYRFMRDKPFGTPMTVSSREMSYFMAAVKTMKQPRLYSIDEITPDMYGSRIRMICDGMLNSFEGRLLKVKGSRKKRLIVELDGLLAVVVEIASADYIEID